MMPPVSYVAFMMPPAGFEPTNSLQRTDLKSVAFDHSAKMAREGAPTKLGPDGIGISYSCHFRTAMHSRLYENYYGLNIDIDIRIPFIRTK